MVIRQDTVPSVLNYHIPSSSDSSEEPESKRKKLTEDVTIASRLRSGSYHSLEALQSDVDKVTSILSAIKPGSRPLNGVPQGRTMPLTTEERKTVARILGFKQLLNNLLLREKSRKASVLEDRKPTENSKEEDDNTNQSTPVAGKVAAEQRGDRVVLTLHGGTSNAKQMFSSLPIPIKTDEKLQSDVSQQPKLKGCTVDPDTPMLTDINIPVRETQLPPGISITKVIPANANEQINSKIKVPTIGELFPPPFTAPPLPLPKQSKHTTTRHTTIGWYDPSKNVNSRPVAPSLPGSYSSQHLSSAQWLNYNVSPNLPQPSSPDAKQRQRARTLSTGDTKFTLPAVAIAAHSRAKEDALFRRVYSSFAPCEDDSLAVVSSQIKNRIWWDRVGASQFEQLFQPVLTNASEGPTVETGKEQTIDPDDYISLEEAIQIWTPEDPPVDPALDSESAVSEKDVDQVLRDISELLETLNSHQRNRNLSLASSSTTQRAILGQNKQTSSNNGSPSTPSPVEFDTYSILKSQLALLIGSLPPYAVAKLDGDQIAELNLSTTILTESKDYKGVLDDDEAISAHRQAALSTSAGVRSSSAQQVPFQTPGGYQTRPVYGPAQSAARAAPTTQQMPPHYYQQQRPFPNRPPQSAPARHPSDPAQLYNPQRPPSGSPRPNASFTPTPSSYAQPNGARASQYSGTNPGQYFQSSAQPQNLYNSNQSQYNNTPSSQQGQTPTRYPPQGTSTPFQHRPNIPQGNYTSTPYSAARSASPQKSGSIPLHMQPGQQRPPFTPRTDTDRRYFATPGPAGTASGSQAQSGPPRQASPLNTSLGPVTNVMGATGYHTVMSPEAQTEMMERQRAQLAAQQQVQMRTVKAQEDGRAEQGAVTVTVNGDKGGV